MSIFINEASIVLASTAVFTYSALFYMQAPKVGIYIIEGEFTFYYSNIRFSILEGCEVSLGIFFVTVLEVGHVICYLFMSDTICSYTLNTIPPENTSRDNLMVLPFQNPRTPLSWKIFRIASVVFAPLAL